MVLLTKRGRVAKIKKFNYGNILISLLILIIIPHFNLNAANSNISIGKKEVFKRNKASCQRLGNIYDACQWMLKFEVKNNSREPLKNFCFNVKVNNRAFELCYGNSKKFSIDKGKSKTFIINLTEQLRVSMDDERPFVKISFN